MKFAFASLCTAAALLCASPSDASTVTVDFFGSNLTGDLGSSTHSFSTVGGSVVATVFDSTYTAGTTPTLTDITSSSTNHLYGKYQTSGGNVVTGASAETGMGTTLDSDHEILQTDSIKVDFSALTSAYPGSIVLNFGSLTSTERLAIFGATGTTNSPTASFVALGAEGVGSVTITASEVAEFGGVFYVTEGGGSSSNNILLQSAIVGVPEPSSIVMGLSSLSAIAAYGFYRRRKTATVLAV